MDASLYQNMRANLSPDILAQYPGANLANPSLLSYLTAQQNNYAQQQTWAQNVRNARQNPSLDPSKFWGNVAASGQQGIAGGGGPMRPYQPGAVLGKGGQPAAYSPAQYGDKIGINPATGRMETIIGYEPSGRPKFAEAQQSTAQRRKTAAGNIVSAPSPSGWQTAAPLGNAYTVFPQTTTGGNYKAPTLANGSYAW